MECKKINSIDNYGTFQDYINIKRLSGTELNKLLLYAMKQSETLRYHTPFYARVVPEYSNYCNCYRLPVAFRTKSCIFQMPGTSKGSIEWGLNCTTSTKVEHRNISTIVPSQSTSTPVKSVTPVESKSESVIPTKAWTSNNTRPILQLNKHTLPVNDVSVNTPTAADTIPVVVPNSVTPVPVQESIPMVTSDIVTIHPKPVPTNSTVFVPVVMPIPHRTMDGYPELSSKPLSKKG